jgi:hypothetical protein
MSPEGLGLRALPRDGSCARLEDVMGVAVRSVLVLVVGLMLAACSQAGSAGQNPDCVPSVPVALNTPGDPNTKIEDIIEYLTGKRQTGDLDAVEETIDDPNFGGVWGDFWGGVVVAVLDCSKVNADTLAEMAGGSGKLHLIEVPYTFKQVNAFRDTLVHELNELGIEGLVEIHADWGGRQIEVYVRGPASLPRSFGAGVPNDAYRVLEGAPTTTH